MDAHAQYEIRQYATVIGNEIVSKWAPLTWEAFLDYHHNSMSLSKTEIELLTMIYAGKKEDAQNKLTQIGWIKKQNEVWKPSREATEFAEKLDTLGLAAPWNS